MTRTVDVDLTESLPVHVTPQLIDAADGHIFGAPRRELINNYTHARAQQQVAEDSPADQEFQNSGLTSQFAPPQACGWRAAGCPNTWR